MRVTADVGVVFGSGLAALPEGAAVESETGLETLGWPVPAVAGHTAALVVATLPRRRAAPEEGPLRLALVHGRPHLYEGWSDEDLERAVHDLADWGTRRFVLLNACGSLAPDIAVGDVVVGTAVVDLQRPPRGAPPRLPVCDRAAAARVAAALSPTMAARPGVYVAVPGPQYETPAEAAWLARYGDVVGMSTAPEARAARRAGAGLCLVSLVVNRAAAVGSHDEVLAVAARFRASLAAVLPAVLAARWPELGRPASAAPSGAGPAPR